MTALGGIARTLVLGLLVCVSSAAFAQRDPEDKSEMLRRALVAPDAAYLPLDAETICGPTVNSVTPNLRRTDVLVVRTATLPVRSLAELTDFSQDYEKIDNDGTKFFDSLQSGQNEEQILLYGASSRRGTVLWRRASTLMANADVQTPVWLGDGSTAYVEVRLTGPYRVLEDVKKVGKPDGPQASVEVVRVDATRGVSQTVYTASGSGGRLITSRYAPLAAYVRGDGAVQVLGPRGLVGGAVAVPNDPAKGFFSWSDWLPDGKRLLGIRYTFGEQLSQASVVLDIATGTISPFEKSKETTAPKPAAPDALVYTLASAKGNLTRQQTTGSVYGLWIEGSDAKTTGRALVAADARVLKEITPLASAVLFERQSSLVAVPLLRVGKDDFLAARRAQQKQDTLRRAQIISAQAFAYAANHGGQLPPLGELQKFINDPLAFQNPETGVSGFTATYTPGLVDLKKNSGEITLGYLDGPGGRVLVTFGGYVKWEGTP